MPHPHGDPFGPEDEPDEQPSEDWKADCMKWRGRVLAGKYAHWCPDWDFLPVDETTPNEFDCCTCFPVAESHVPESSLDTPASPSSGRE